MSRCVVLLAAGVIGAGLSGCGSTSAPSDSADDAGVAKKHLVLAYHAVNETTMKGLRCHTAARPPDSPPCRHPHFYAPPRILQADVGSTLLHRLIIDVADSPSDADVEGRTYIVSTETGGRKITLAEQARDGTTWVLTGSLSGYKISQLP